MATASTANGQRVNKYTYDAYGNIGSGEGASQPFRYTGRRYDAETGLYYYRARYYSSTLGRFMQTDPIGYEDNMNLYGYVGNDPLNGTDPSGRNGCAIGAGVGAFAGGVGAVPGCAIGATINVVAVVACSIFCDAIFNNDSTFEDAEEILTGGKEPEDVTGPDGEPGRDTDKARKGRGVRNFPDSPTGRPADDVIGDIANLPGAESQPTETPGGPGQVVTLPDGTQVADTPAIPARNGKKGRDRTIQINVGGKPKTKVRFPEKDDRNG